MKIGIVSDIHGNDIALEAVLKEASIKGVEHLLVLGDLVGYYYRPDKVLRMLKKWPNDMIQGNHERMLKAALGDPGAAQEIKKRYGSGIEIALERLTKEEIEELINLPESKNVVFENVSFNLFHGAPWDGNFYVYPDAEKDILDKAASLDADFVLLGHTHHPLRYEKDGTILLNVGSVGQARDESGAACWGIIDTTSKEATLERTPFSSSVLIKEVKKVDPTVPYLHEIFARKRNVI